VAAEDQAETLPVSNPSVKIGSMMGVGVNVGVSEGPSVAVCVGVAEAVDVKDGIGDGIPLAVGVRLETEVGVGVFADKVFVAMGVAEAAGVVTVAIFEAAEKLPPASKATSL